MESALPEIPSAAAVDWFRLFGDVRFRILCIGEGSDELCRALERVHNQEALPAERIENCVVRGDQEPSEADRFDMLCFVGESAGQFDVHSAATKRLLACLRPGGWLCLQSSSRVRGIASLSKLLRGAGFGTVEQLVVYPDFAAPLMVMRPNRRMCAAFFRQIYQPRTMRDALRAAIVRLFLKLGAETSIFRNRLVMARKQ